MRAHPSQKTRRMGHPQVQGWAALSGGTGLGGELDIVEEAEGVFAEDFADVGIGVALLEEGFGDLGEMGGVFHAEWHGGAIEVGAEADMIDAGDFYGVINVLDDFGPVHAGELAGLHVFVDDLVAND